MMASFLLLGETTQGVGQSPEPTSALSKLSLRKKGTSTTFMKRLEIMARDGFSRRNPTLSAVEAVRNLSRYDAIWAAVFVPSYHPQAWKLLREQHPDILALYYMSSDSTRVYDDGYFDFDYITNRHPEWFVLRDVKNPAHSDPRNPDNRIRWKRSNPKSHEYNRFYLDVANPEFQAWAIHQILNNVSGEPQEVHVSYSGLAADNVNIGHRRLKVISDAHPNWKYADRFDDWNRGFCNYLRLAKDALNRRGQVLVANHSLDYGSDIDDECWKQLLESVDGVMTEQALGYSGHYYTGQAWLTSIQRHEAILAKGLIDWWVCYPSPNKKQGYEEFLFNYCSWLLVKRPGRSFFYSTREERGWSNPKTPWYDEYDWKIGQPLSKRKQRGPCWVRFFSNALVVVNPTKRRHTLKLERDRQWVDRWGRKVSMPLEMPPGSGRIWLRKNDLRLGQ